MNHITLGDLGEKAASHYLTTKGYALTHRKYRTKLGEIDIIAKHKNTIVFVEVKTRRNTTYGSPAEAVNYRKQQKIIQTAQCYLKHSNNYNCLCRFDIIEVVLESQGIFTFNHITNAFGE